MQERMPARDGGGWPGLWVVMSGAGGLGLLVGAWALNRWPEAAARSAEYVLRLLGAGT